MSAKCIDCGLEYKQMGLDLVLPDQQWKVLCPENGILCANCICKRAKKLGGTVILAWIDNLDYSNPHNPSKFDYKSLEEARVKLITVNKLIESISKKIHTKF